MFMDDQLGLLNESAFHSAVGSNCVLHPAEDWPTFDYDHRHWLDSKMNNTDILCQPGYCPPGFDNPSGCITNYHQNTTTVVGADLVWPKVGQVWQYPATPNGPFYRGTSGTKDDIQICPGNHARHVVNLINDCHLPASLYTRVYLLEITRSYLHELGHTFGINHHVPDSVGSHDCVMKYESVDDYPPDSVGWEEFIWGTGYLDDNWNCATEKGFRP